MIYPATQSIYDHFTGNGTKCRIVEQDTVSFVEAGFSGKNVAGILLRFISNSDHNDVALRSAPIARIPAERMESVCRILNDCNCRFRFLKFVVDNERDITAQCDLPQALPLEDVGPAAMELFVRSMQIIDACHPDIMRSIYSEFVL